MALEETVKSRDTLPVVDHDGSFPKPIGKGKGETVAVDDSKEAAVNKPPANQTHPLQHVWTFWFDNTSAKSKQTAWGASMHPIFTFSTVEEFWRFGSFFYLSIYYLIMIIRT